MAVLVWHHHISFTSHNHTVLAPARQRAKPSLKPRRKWHQARGPREMSSCPSTVAVRWVLRDVSSVLGPCHRSRVRPAASEVPNSGELMVVVGKACVIPGSTPSVPDHSRAIHGRSLPSPSPCQENFIPCLIICNWFQEREGTSQADPSLPSDPRGC